MRVGPFALVVPWQGGSWLSRRSLKGIHTVQPRRIGQLAPRKIVGRSGSRVHRSIGVVGHKASDSASRGPSLPQHSTTKKVCVVGRVYLGAPNECERCRRADSPGRKIPKQLEPKGCCRVADDHPSPSMEQYTLPRAGCRVDCLPSRRDHH